MTYEIPVTRARAEFADLVNRVVYGGERVVVTRHGRPIVALVPAADLDKLDQPDEPPTGTVVAFPTTERAGATESTVRRPYDIAARHDDGSHRPLR